MVDVSTANGHDALEEMLGRLSNKPGVKASLVLDRARGNILKTSGDLSALRTARSRNASTAASFSNEVPAAEESESRGMDEFAATIWNFVQGAGGMVADLDAEDEMRLLRLRTKKQEIVIVPDPKYLLVVVHDTPPA